MYSCRLIFKSLLYFCLVQFFPSFIWSSYLLLSQRLLYELLKKLDAELKHEACHWAAYYVSIYSFSFWKYPNLLDSIGDDEIQERQQCSRSGFGWFYYRAVELMELIWSSILMPQYWYWELGHGSVIIIVLSPRKWKTRKK